MKLEHNTHYRKHRAGKWLPLFCSTVFMVALSSCYGPVEPAKKPDDEAAAPGIRGWADAKVESLKEADAHDPEAKLSREDYYNLFFKNNKHTLGTGESSAPRLALPGINDLMMAPEEPAIPDDKLVTLMVTDDIPLKDVLVELSRRADIDMEIDPNITGGVILSARDKPFSEIIGRIAGMANLKYSFDRGVLKVERDMPEVHSFRMNILNMVRTSSGQVTSGTQIGGGGEGAAGNSTGSTSTIDTVTDQGDLWGMVQDGINNILAQYRPVGLTRGGSVDVAAAAPAAAAPTAAGGTGTTAAPGSSGILSLNRQAGLISVMATELQTKAIKTYLDEIHRAYSSQVLIEAKVMEVTLSDDFRSGINWNFLNNNVTGLVAGGEFDDFGSLGAAASQTFTLGVLPAEFLGLDNTSIDAAIELVENFGTTRTLSSPRINAMNNQQATLTFAENFVYFEIDVEESQDGTSGDTTTTIDTTINTVPVGVILNILPSIDTDRNEIILSVRPTLTRISELREDPGFTLQAAQFGVDDLTTEVPVVDVRELDSVMRIKNGEVLVIGGLMEETSNNNDRGVPGLSRIPIIGNAFKSVQRTGSVVETVIFIKATIIPGGGVTEEDKKFYNTFSADHRPLKM